MSKVDISPPVMLRSLIALCLLSFALLKIIDSPPGQDHVIAAGWWVATVMEVLLAVFLVSRYWRPGAWGTVVLGLGGLLGLVYMRRVGIAVESCGCFGAVEFSATWHVLICVALVGAGGSLLLDWSTDNARAPGGV